RSFVDGVSIDADDRAIGSAIIAMARHLGMSVVAEGVELLVQASELNTSGCHNGQGFLYARPLSPEDFADGLREHSDAFSLPGRVLEPAAATVSDQDGDKG
ncbi:MAG TPA: EAL domain-containing protein, partial [Accumulibacter sp.]|nr:EAL domain-containing protein [Accumulibacter sp.]